MDYINYNGQLLPAGTPIVAADNRGLRFGDGLFETIRYRQGNLQMSEAHFDRLWKGMQLFQFRLPALFSKEFLHKEILRLLQKNKHSYARVRLTIVRGNGGIFDPADHTPVFIIQSWQLEEDFGKLNSNGLQVSIYRDILKSCDTFSSLKHNNFLPYTMGALYAKENRCNDSIILNQHHRISDTCIANIFFIKDNIIYTPSLSEGCIAGTMRHFLLNHLPTAGFRVIEKEITETEALNADEIFLSNALTPIKWVAAVEEHTYDRQLINRIYTQLHQTFPTIFC